MTDDNIESIWRQTMRSSADNAPMDFARALVAAERERRAEPLQRLGARLASLLDEDQWAECEALLLEAGVGPNVQDERAR